MATKTYCDICEEEIHDSSGKWNIIYNMQNHFDCWNEPEFFCNKEICRKCANKMPDWFQLIKVIKSGVCRAITSGALESDKPNVDIPESPEPDCESKPARGQRVDHSDNRT